MFLTVDSSIEIGASAEAVWDFASQPQNWTASNPAEHYGLRFSSADNLPHEGVEFDQDESVAGLRARLHGRFHYFARPRLAFWSGIATYRLLGGLLPTRVSEGGVLRIEDTADGVRLSHNVYIDFPASLWGRLMRFAFERMLDGRRAVYAHARRELDYFKAQVEATGRRGAETRTPAMEGVAA